jgi:hypothetical protein
MDWIKDDLPKYPVDKVVVFVAALIPGAAALLIFQSAHPGTFAWFFALGFLGYRTKVTLIVIAAFVIGYSLSKWFGMVLGMIGGAIGGSLKVVLPSSLAVAPWRDPRWRLALSRYLGAQAPQNMELITQDIYDQKLQIINLKPAPQQASATIDLKIERIETELNDSVWSRWYAQFHAAVHTQRLGDWTRQVQHGLDLNLQTAALVILIAAIWVPAIRQWWLMLLAFGWVAACVLQFWGELVVYTKHWTINEQIKYFLEAPPL